MGDWRLVIEGHGSHHNKDVAEDANILAGEFVDRLRAKGQHVRQVTFYAGEGQPGDDLTAGAEANRRFYGEMVPPAAEDVKQSRRHRLRVAADEPESPPPEPPASVVGEEESPSPDAEPL
jgi:hypothetical protein